MLASIELFSIKHGIDPDKMIRCRDIAGAMQLMHADGVMRGGRYVWANFFDPEPELVARFEGMSSADEIGWESLEPEYTP